MSQVPRPRPGAAPLPRSVLITPALLRRWPLPRPDGALGKEGRGSVLVVGGSAEIPGAVMLAAVAALRVGAGKLHVATGRSVAPLLAIALPEARVTGLPENAAGQLRRGSGERLRPDLKRCASLLVGPGMDDSASHVARDLVRTCMTAAPAAPLIIDAGGLAAFAGRDRFARRHRGQVIATPHAGEMAALWGVDRQVVMDQAAAIAHQAAAEMGVTVVLKGQRTYVAGPGGRLFHNTAGNSGLGTSGSGDTLSGIIAGLCARGAEPVQAAVWGVFLHAKAGEALAAKVGQLGFLARELLFELPGLLTALARRRPSIGPRRRARSGP